MIDTVSGYQASLSQSQERKSWAIIFRHPMKRDEISGKLGKRIRGGLGTRDKDQAERLVGQMNQMLANKRFWDIGAKDAALQSFDRVVVDLFYKDLEPEALDFEAIRSKFIPLPSSQESPYRRVLLLGTTGAGKTTLVRQFMGSHPRLDRFPSTSTARTTVADMEIVFKEGEYGAIITFHRQDEVRDVLEQAAFAAARGAFRGEPDEKVMQRLLVDPDQRFRFNFILGDGRPPGESDSEGEFDFDAEIEEGSDDGDALDLDMSPHEGIDTEQTANLLRESIANLRTLGEKHGEAVRKELGAETEEETQQADELFEEQLETYLHQDPEFQNVLDDLMDEIEKRFDCVQVGEMDRRNGWPIQWHWTTSDRSEFMSTVRRYSSNYARFFGQLLTPLVNGMRVAGPFVPDWGSSNIPNLVLIDGEGLGHTMESATSVSTSVTRKFDQVDAILLVDNGEQPMLASTEAAMRAIVSTGNVSRLLLAFTHFDAVKGDNIKSVDAKKQHILNSAEHAVLSIGQRLGGFAERALRQRIALGSFFVGGIDKILDPSRQGGRFTIQNLNNLLDAVERINERPEIGESRPVYDRMNLAFAIQKATEAFHDRWQPLIGMRFKPGVSKEHWTRIKALSRRLATGWADEYKELRPVADLHQELADQIYIFIEQPASWDGPEPYREEKQQIVDTFTNEVSRRVMSLAIQRLGRDHLADWQDAYYQSGRGSAMDRATIISRRIYDRAAAIPKSVPVPDSSQLFDDVISALTEAAEVVNARLR